MPVHQRHTKMIPVQVTTTVMQEQETYTITFTKEEYKLFKGGLGRVSHHHLTQAGMNDDQATLINNLYFDNLTLGKS